MVVTKFLIYYFDIVIVCRDPQGQVFLERICRSPALVMTAAFLGEQTMEALTSGAVIEVAEGKNAAARDPFWKRLKHSRARGEAVATEADAPGEKSSRGPDGS